MFQQLKSNSTKTHKTIYNKLQGTFSLIISTDLTIFVRVNFRDFPPNNVLKESLL